MRSLPPALVGVLLMGFVALTAGQVICGDADVLYSRGVELFHLEDWDAALEALESALELGPDADFSGDATFKKAECLYRLGRLEQALYGFRDYIAVYPMGPNRRAAQLRVESIERKLDLRGMAPPTLPGSAGPLGAVVVETITAHEWPMFESRLLDLKRSGLDTVIIRAYLDPMLTRHALFPKGPEGGVYFATDRAPVAGALMKQAVALGHKYGLRVFALMTTRESDWALSRNPGMACAAWDFSGRRVVNVRGLDLFNESAVAELEALYADLGATGVDGIILADDLRLRQHEGFSRAGLELYENTYGEGLDPEQCFINVVQDPGGRFHVGEYSEGFKRWAGFKSSRMIEVAERLGRAAKSRNPNCRIGMTLTPFALTDAESALAHYGHDFSAASRSKLDYLLIPMEHRRLQRDLALTGQQTFSLMRRVTELAADASGKPERVMIQVQVIDRDSLRVLPDWELEAALFAVLGQRRVSVALAPYKPSIKWENVGQMLKTDSEGANQ